MPVILDVWQGFEYASSFNKYARFWICRDSEYATVKYRSEYPWMCLNNNERLHISEYYRANRLANVICYFAALPNTENQLFIDGKAQVQCTRYNK